MKYFVLVLFSLALLFGCQPAEKDIPEGAAAKEAEMAETIGITVEEFRQLDSVQQRRMYREALREEE